MRINPAGIEIIKKYETLKLSAYWDVNAYSVGWGHHGPDVTEHMVVTPDQANDFFVQDIEEAETEMAHMIQMAVNDNQWSALVSFTFNEGVGHLHGSTLLHLVNLGEFTAAANEFPKWKYVSGKPNDRLLDRRLEEKALFLTPANDV